MPNAKSQLGTRILYANLAAYIFAIIVTCLEYVLSFVVEDDDYSIQMCRKQMTLTYTYILVNISSILRISASCYMNLRFSQPFKNLKQQFVIVFCSDEIINDMDIDQETLAEILFLRRQL